MRRIICFVFLLFLGGCASVHSAIKNDAVFTKYQKIYLVNYENDPRKVLPRVRERLEKLGYSVILTDPDEPVGGNQGTGFIISPEGYILTSAHVLGKQKEATVWLNGKRYEVELVYKEARQEDDEKTKKMLQSKDLQEAMDASLNSEDNRSISDVLNNKDMALLKIKFPDQPYVPLRLAVNPTYAMGQEVYTIGFPLSHILGDKPRLNKGLISSSVGVKDNPNYIQISTEIQPGNSGGPLLSANGLVIGLVQMTLNPADVISKTGGSLPQNVNFAVKLSLIQEFLKDAESQARIAIVEGGEMPFENVQNSIVQVRSGIIPEGFKEESKLVCGVRYVYLWDMWYRFQTLDIVFYDFDSDEVLLRAGQYQDNPFSNEDSTLDSVFKEIKKKLSR